MGGVHCGLFFLFVLFCFLLPACSKSCYIKQEYTHLLAENPQKTGWSGDGQNRFVLVMSIFASLIKSASFLDHKADVLKGLCHSCSQLSNVFDFVFSSQRHFSLRKVVKKTQLGAERNNKHDINNKQQDLLHSQHLWRDLHYRLHSEFAIN